MQMVPLGIYPQSGMQVIGQQGPGMQMMGQQNPGMQIMPPSGPGMQIILQPVPGMPVMAQPAPGMQIIPQSGPGTQITPAAPTTVPEKPPGCPTGLEYLCNVDNLLVEQEIDTLEILSGYEQNNKYSVKNGMGQTVYYAVEDTPFCTRMCCGNSRPFDMKILDNSKTEVIHIRRDLACSSCCFPCCLQTVRVYSPPGVSIGTVKQCWSICNPSFVVNNEKGLPALRIKGPCCFFSCGDIDFEVLNAQDAKVGNISKQWSGFAQEMISDADNFNISFPKSLDVKVKALLLGALFLIDFMYFEKKN